MCMKDKENQIEEMAKDLHEELETENIPYYECDFMAQRLISKGWIKPLKDSVVQPTVQSYSTHDNDLVMISREEYERLCSSHDIIFCDNKNCSDNLLCRCCEISECPKNIPEYNKKLSANKYKLDLFQKLCRERERADGWKDRYKLLEEELKQEHKETAEKIITNEIKTIKCIRDACILPEPAYREGYIDCCNGILFYLENNIAKQFGVEIKE